MLNLIIFGAPGAGKGTQAALIAERYGLVHISTGEVIRAEMQAGSPMGILAERAMEGGNLAPDSLVIDIISKRIDENPDTKGFIFDGFPRTLPQAKALDEMLNRKKMPLLALLAIEVDKPELLNRIAARAEAEGRPEDMSLEITENRIQVYFTQTMPLIDYYSAQGKYHNVSGTDTIENVFSLLCRIVNTRKKGGS